MIDCPICPDPIQRQSIEDLLAAHFVEGSFLDHPAGVDHAATAEYPAPEATNLLDPGITRELGDTSRGPKIGGEAMHSRLLTETAINIHRFKTLAIGFKGNMPLLGVSTAGIASGVELRRGGRVRRCSG